MSLVSVQAKLFLRGVSQCDHEEYLSNVITIFIGIFLLEECHDLGESENEF